jgi:hypothetical protein
MTDFAARKQKLAAESEIYRQTLKFELENFQLYGTYVKHKYMRLTALAPLIQAAPVVSQLFASRRHRASRAGLLRMLVTGWQLYQKLAPLIQGFQPPPRRRPSAPAVEPRPLVASL